LASRAICRENEELVFPPRPIVAVVSSCPSSPRRAFLLLEDRLKTVGKIIENCSCGDRTPP